MNETHKIKPILNTNTNKLFYRDEVTNIDNVSYFILKYIIQKIKNKDTKLTLKRYRKEDVI